MWGCAVRKTFEKPSTLHFKADDFLSILNPLRIRGGFFCWCGFFRAMNQVTFIRIDQRLPACVNDIGADADGAEGFG